MQKQRVFSFVGLCWKRFLTAGVLIAAAANVAAPSRAEEEAVLAGQDFIAVKNPKAPATPHSLYPHPAGRAG